MRHATRRAVIVGFLLASPAPGRLTTTSVLAEALAPQDAVAAKDAEDFLRKVQQIRDFEATLPKPASPQRTVIAERELNAWLRVHGTDHLPPGVIEPSLSLEGEGRVSARATVDLDDVKKERRRPGGWFDPWQIIGGRVPVSASGILHTESGIARLELRSAHVSGIPVPKALLQEIVSYYSRSPEDPDGVSLDDSFEMAAGIREVAVDRKQAIVVQ